MSLINYKCECKPTSEAYRLITDHTFLLSLLHSKYGDIQEDYHISYINKLLYSKTSPFLIAYKEHQYNDITEEFFKRYYNNKESKERLPKLSEYYKNYHLFFCRPLFRNWSLCDIMNNYGDNQAEVFYKVNYAQEIKERSKHKGSELNDNIDNDSNSMSNNSKDNNGINNKTIFDKKTRLIIDKLANAYQRKEGNDNCDGNNKGTITMTLDSSRLNTNALYSKRSKNNSFMNLINGIIQQTQTNGVSVNENKKMNCVMNNTHNNNKHNNGQQLHKQFPQQKVKSFRMKSSLCTLTKVHIDKNNNNIIPNTHHHTNHASGSISITSNNNNNNNNNNANNGNTIFNSTINNNNTSNTKKTLLSPKLKPYLTTFNSNIGEFNKHKPKYHYNNKKHSIKQPTNNFNSLTNPHTLTHIHTHTQPLSHTTTTHKNQTFYYNNKQPPNTYNKPSTYKKIYYSGLTIKKPTNQNSSARITSANKTFGTTNPHLISISKSKNQTPNTNNKSTNNGNNISTIKCNKNILSSNKKHNAIHSANMFPSSSSSIPKYNSTNHANKNIKANYSTLNANKTNKQKKIPNTSFTNMLNTIRKVGKHPTLGNNTNNTNVKVIQSTRGVNHINNLHLSQRVRSESLKRKCNDKTALIVKSRNSKLKQKQNLHSVRSLIKDKNASRSNTNKKNKKECKSKEKDKHNESKIDSNLRTYRQIEVNRGDINRGNSMKPINVNINMNLRMKSKGKKGNKVMSP